MYLSALLLRIRRLSNILCFIAWKLFIIDGLYDLNPGLLLRELVGLRFYGSLGDFETLLIFGKVLIFGDLLLIVFCIREPFPNICQDFFLMSDAKVALSKLFAEFTGDFILSMKPIWVLFIYKHPEYL